MQRLDLSLTRPEDNLALDEALLLQRCARVREDGEAAAPEVLRFWESPVNFVVMGVSGKVREEVDVERCTQEAVPFLRRHSGGGTVVQGPGCLNYCLILSAERPGYGNYTRCYEDILARVAAGLGVPGLAAAGTSDIAIGPRKVSGNAQKRKESSILHHGTLLHDFSADLMTRYLREPSRRPEYRGARVHEEFVRDLPLEPDEIRTRLAAAWGAEAPYDGPVPETASLVREKYGLDEWTWRF